MNYDIEFDVDPLFKKTTAKFDEQGASGLLVNNLFMDANMMLMLESAQPSDILAEQEERKEMAHHMKIAQKLSQECSNYWRIADTSQLFSTKSMLAERLGVFKKLLQETETADSEFKLVNEVRKGSCLTAV